MKKELRPFHDAVSCDVCGRTILKGERAESYLVAGGERKLVCDLCAPRALHEGWIRESGPSDLPAARRRPEQRGSLIGRLFRRRPHEPADADDGMPAWEEEPDAPPARERPVREQREVPRDPRHVRAVPTTADVKVERALELFNGSEHVRSIAGIMRSLGAPWVAAAPDLAAPSKVDLLIAWELSWYRYRVDLGDAGEAVTLLDKGEELDQLEGEPPDWNVQASPDGRLALGVGSAP
ncbi:MAG TPA: hypothetical protein VD790_11310 [Thermoleophilaceae bacterium]|nr:hypothetical protein [Thermoleophilaceae bacterium]